MKIYVINLERDLRRRETMLAQLVGADVELLRAVDASTLPAATLKAAVYHQQWLKEMRGTVGCFLSHMAAWEKISAAEQPYGVVLEDDVHIESLTRLDELKLPPDAGIVFINDRMVLHNDSVDPNDVFPIREVFPRLDALKLAGGGDGYILSREAARRLLDACEQEGLYGHVDGRLLRYASTEDDLASQPRGSWITEVIRYHHNPARVPSLGIVRGYVLAKPIVWHQAQNSTRAETDSATVAPQQTPSALLAAPAAGAAVESVSGIPIRYWNRIRNVGDIANPYVIEQVSGYKPRFSFNDQAPHVLGIGSVLFMATPASVIWGSGVLDPRHPLAAIPAANVRAVRGTLTREHLRAALGIDAGVPLGDPGIFIDELPEVKALVANRPAKRYRYALIPHHDMLAHEYFRALAKEPDVLLLDVRSDLFTFIEGMLSAEIVISQSLHGLIFAETLGIPQAWLSHSEDDIWQFKFRDWFSTTSEPGRKPLLLGASLDQLRSEARLAGSTIDRAALQAAFPRELKAPRTARYDHRQTRALAPLLVFADTGTALNGQPFAARKVQVKPKDDESLRVELNAITREYDEACETIIVFDSQFFAALSIELINKAAQLLDRHVNMHYVHLIPRTLLPSEPGPLHHRDGLLISDATWPSCRWNGLVIARHGVNFSFNAPGMTVVG